MKINVFDPKDCSGFEPLTCTRSLKHCQAAGTTIEELLKLRILLVAEANKISDVDFTINVRSDFWPSENILLTVLTHKVAVQAPDNELYCYIESHTDNRVEPDIDSLCLNYSWDILKINEQLIANLQDSSIEGTIRENVVIDGNIVLGEGSVLLPGVYIEGNAIIGKNCKIGPNCYIRGNTHIGDNCHVGQAVEIKNSILMTKVSVGHLGYVGDAIIGEKTNFGAGTVMANLRHDGKNHKSIINRKTVDTGRRKFGVIIGDDVHTGINTSLYPGRKMWPKTSTKPGEIVSRDKEQ